MLPCAEAHWLSGRREERRLAKAAKIRPTCHQTPSVAVAPRS